MRTFYNEPNQQVKSYNDKIMPNLIEYYYLDGIESMGKIKAINIKSIFLNEKYHIKIKYISGNKKIYSRVYPREAFRDKYIFVKIESRKNPYNYKSILFVVPIEKYQKMNTRTLLKEIAHSGYINPIKEKINIDFSIKKKYYYLVENPILYPEEHCNAKFTIIDDEYIQNFMDLQEKNIEFVEKEKGILPTMKVNYK